MARIIAAEDDDDNDAKLNGADDGNSGGGERAILICTHAASMIAIGRALTGRMPEDVCEDDFGTFTCGVSKFRRRLKGRSADGGIDHGMLEKWEAGMAVPRLDWRDGKGVSGGWGCEVNCYCGHLQDGKERGWFVFHSCFLSIVCKNLILRWAGVSMMQKFFPRTWCTLTDT